MTIQPSPRKSERALGQAKDDSDVLLRKSLPMGQHRMKATLLASILTLSSLCLAQAFDPEKASTERFKVSFVETDKLPPLSEISKLFYGRESALKGQKELIELGADAKRLDQFRRTRLRHLYFPIRITDTETGNIYEVQKDRRTIVGKTRDGKLLWKVNPFEDAKLKPYRVKHPIITYFGKSTMPVRTEKGDRFLGVAFNSSQFGVIDLSSGSFTFHGND